MTSTDADDATGAVRRASNAAVPDGGHDPWTVTAVVVAAMLITGCVAAALSAIVPSRTEIPGLPTAGSITAFALPAVKAIFDLAAAVTVGWLLAAAWLVPPQRSGILDVGGYRAIKAASLAAAVWCAAGLALIPLILSDTLGKSLADSVAADWVISGISILDSVRAALIAAVAAALIAVLARIVLHPGWAAVLLALALIAVVAQSNTGHAAGTSDHDVAVDTMIFHLVGISLWVGGLVAFLGLARQNVAQLPVIARRYSTIAFWAFIAVALSGFGNAWVRITYLPDLWRTDYGRLVLLKAGLLITLGVIGYLHRKRTLPAITDDGDRRPLIRLAAVEVGIMAATIGVASALARTSTPPPSAAAPSDTELVLGYDLAGPPTLLRLIADWRFDWILGTAVIIAAVLYLLAVRRLRLRGDHWPPGRTVAWVTGCVMVLIATSSGLGRYAEAQFSIHMSAHMLLGMIAPILLVLGGPMSLALRALPAARRGDVPGLREAIVTALHSKPARIITHPLVVFPLFIISFPALYFSSLFEVMIASHLGHLVMNLHFLLVGYLYYWVIIGVDPAPRQVQPMVKLAMLIGALPFHAFFGLALMNSHQAMALDYYNSLGLGWVTDLVGEQRLGGAIAWGATEVPIIIVMIALLSQWAKSDEREARRSDRIGDRAGDHELDAYNRMLAGLAERDRAAGARFAGNADQPGAGQVGVGSAVIDDDAGHSDAAGRDLAGDGPAGQDAPSGGDWVDPVAPEGGRR
ncbi:MAG: bifunctional copper resistance protein CopD/cytochrome c oxidase assembly protein [Nakamurella sp.]